VFPSEQSSTGHISEKSSKGSFWRRITERAGLYDPNNPNIHITIRDLRRTAATYQLFVSKDLKKTAKLLGHSSTRVTEKVYTIVKAMELKPDIEQSVSVMMELVDKTEVQ
jgi:integrase